MITASLYLFQEKLLFLPTKLEQEHQFQFNFDFEEVFLKNDDGARINAIHFKVKNPKGVILYYHGNAGDLQRWGHITEYFVAMQYDVFVMDYRTYGKSTGPLSEQALYDDALLCYEYVKSRYNESEITVYGRSLGTGLATFVSSKNSPKQLVLETPYYSILDVANHRFPFLPVKRLLKYTIPSYEFLRDVNCDVTIFHGTDDGVIPISSAKKLSELLPTSTSRFIIIEGGAHNNLIEFEPYHQTVNQIL